MVCPVIVVRQGNKYGHEYVEKLERQVNKTSRLPLIVLGDQFDANIELQYGYEGWWAKMELFRPDIPKPFIYVDLDSFVLKDISYMADLPGNWISREWWRGMNGVQSSVMKISDSREIWRKWLVYEHQYLGHRMGDQEFLKIFDWHYFQTEYPGAVGSYKMHSKDKPVHDIVTFHGRPKMKDAGGWAEELWNSL